MRSKDEFFYIIHDKMDHAKIAFPRLQVWNKMISRLRQTTHYPHGYDNMVMGMRDMHNILMSCGQMIPISQLDPSCSFCGLWRRFLFQSINYCLNTPCRIHYLHIFCKGNCVAYVNYTPRIKLLVQNLCRKICCFKWVITWKAIRINIC